MVVLIMQVIKTKVYLNISNMFKRDEKILSVPRNLFLGEHEPLLPAICKHFKLITMEFNFVDKIKTREKLIVLDINVKLYQIKA